MPITHGLTDAQIIVNAVRECLGLAPLYVLERESEKTVEIERARGKHDYFKIKRLNDAACADCERCGGSGYYDGEQTYMTCACTGFASRQSGDQRRRYSRSDKQRAFMHQRKVG